MPNYDHHRRAPKVVPCLHARLDAASGLRFQADLLKLADEGHDRMILDLSGVRSISSSAIASLLGVLKILGHRGALVLAGLSEQLSRALALTRMDRIFCVQSDIASALRYLAA